MASSRFNRDWCKKTEKIFNVSQMSIVTKLLAYKILLRPLLLYGWFESQNSQLKSLEIQALRRIFGSKSEHALYEKYTDIDVTGYLKTYQIRWKRLTGSDPNHLCTLIHTASKTADNPYLYFIRASERRKRSSCSRRNTNTNYLLNLEHLQTKLSNMRGLRRSGRIAVKNNKKTNTR